MIGNTLMVYSNLEDAAAPQKIRKDAITRDSSGIHHISSFSVIAIIIVAKKIMNNIKIVTISSVAGIVLFLIFIKFVVR
jgi:hypothetical protein